MTVDLVTSWYICTKVFTNCFIFFHIKCKLRPNVLLPLPTSCWHWDHIGVYTLTEVSDHVTLIVFLPTHPATKLYFASTAKADLWADHASVADIFVLFLFIDKKCHYTLSCLCIHFYLIIVWIQSEKRPVDDNYDKTIFLTTYIKKKQNTFYWAFFTRFSQPTQPYQILQPASVCNPMSANTPIGHGFNIVRKLVANNLDNVISNAKCMEKKLIEYNNSQ